MLVASANTSVPGNKLFADATNNPASRLHANGRSRNTADAASNDIIALIRRVRELWFICRLWGLGGTRYGGVHANNDV